MTSTSKRPRPQPLTESAAWIAGSGFLMLLGLGVFALIAAMARPMPQAGADTAPSSALLADPRRGELERIRDAGTRPLELYEHFGVTEGMAVADLMPSAGYHTFLLSHLVGPRGSVVAVPGGDGLRRRVQRDGLDNVRVLENWEQFEERSVDVILTVRNLHDIEAREPYDPPYAIWYAALKPGGTLAVVDARTPTPGVDRATHRIHRDRVVERLTGAGFVLHEESDLLARGGDDYTDSGFNTEGRWNIDRLVMTFRRPAE